MAIKLRKKAPFYCRRKDFSGRFNHLDRPLLESEGDLCNDCQAAADKARDKFFNVCVPKPRLDEQPVKLRQIWPI